MTKATAYFLTRLKSYLDGQPTAKRRELQNLHAGIADGKKLHTSHLSRHLNCKLTPNMDTVIVYLQFAQSNGIITTQGAKGLFLYVDDDARPARAKRTAKKRG